MDPRAGLRAFRMPRVVLALLAIAPAVVPMAFFLVGDFQLLTDPCHAWAMGNGGVLSPSAGCPRSSGSSQTLAEYVWTMVWVKGAVLLGASLAVAGIVRAHGPLGVAGAWVLFAVSLPLMLGFSGAPVLLAAALVLAAQRAVALRGAALWAARGLALLVAAGAIFQVAGAAVSGIWQYAVYSALLLVIPAIMLAAAWWPHSRGAAS